jgi:hypothetical protein
MHLEFHLARELGMTVARLREEMSMRELLEWSAFYGLEAQWAEVRRGG